MTISHTWDDDTFVAPQFKITAFTHDGGKADVTMDSAKLAHETVVRLLNNAEVLSIKVENLGVAHSAIGAALDQVAV